MKLLQRASLLLLSLPLISCSGGSDSSSVWNVPEKFLTGETKERSINCKSLSGVELSKEATEGSPEESWAVNLLVIANVKYTRYKFQSEQEARKAYEEIKSKM